MYMQKNCRLQAGLVFDKEVLNMVTIIIHRDDYNKTCDIRGLSTDTKPTAPNGSTFIEMDTGKGFLFDAENGLWHELSSGGAVTIQVATGVSF